MSRVKRREDVFYSLLKEFGDKIVATSKLYQEIIDSYPTNSDKIEKMHDMEHECDALIDKIVIELAQSFITPFDREDIVTLSHVLDDVVDSMYGVVERLYIFHIEEIRPDLAGLAVTTGKAVDATRKMLEHLPDFRRDKVVIDCIHEINQLENEADDQYHDALSKLFDGSCDPIDVIRWNEVYKMMELATDACQRAAFVVQGVIIKNA